MNVLYDLYFKDWYENKLTPNQRRELASNEAFQHAKKICLEETDKQQFFFWLDKAKEEVIDYLRLLSEEDVEKLKNKKFDKYSVEYKYCQSARAWSEKTDIHAALLKDDNY